jgi:hypothetical protein
MGRVINITEKQAEAMIGKTFAPDSYFNPIQDKNGQWVISEEEAVHLRSDKEDYEPFQFIKQLPRKTHEPKEDILQDEEATDTDPNDNIGK